MTLEEPPTAIDWEELYIRVRPTLLRALAVTTGSYEGVEDAIQDAFSTALSGHHDVRSAEGWLYTVARNRLLRRRWRDRLFRPLKDTASSESELDAALTRVRLIRALLRLSRRERELLVTKYYLGMSQEEIARMLGVPRGTVSAAVSRAAARCRALEEEA
jgi:RNA polymerase sigma factor (sigma-70 family)